MRRMRASVRSGIWASAIIVLMAARRSCGRLDVPERLGEDLGHARGAPRVTVHHGLGDEVFAVVEVAVEQRDRDAGLGRDPLYAELGHSVALDLERRGVDVIT